MKHVIPIYLLIGLLMCLLAPAYTHAAAEERDVPKEKKPAAKRASNDGKNAMQLRKPPATQSTPKSAKPTVPAYVAPDLKMLGLGCASGED